MVVVWNVDCFKREPGINAPSTVGGLGICTPFSSAFVIELTRDIILNGAGLKVEARFAFEDVFLMSDAATFFEAGVELEVGKNEDAWLRFWF